ncbi:MAG: pyridoxamine 5'-phosphate oxidase [Bacteroidia bacterium]|nr:pyridoxamine 5'-phosphate oxidase [Bacteroidia bacterium]
MGHQSIYSLRKQYSKHRLDEEDLNPNPIRQFQSWMEQALAAELEEPYAMTLSSIGLDGFPDSRIVLLRKADENGFTFFTNYDSQKGIQIQKHPQVSINFFWAGLERQVRIKGTIRKLSEEDSDAYFSSRPRESQVGAWASQQSQFLESREWLEKRVQELSIEFENKPVPRPTHWGGYLVEPVQIEFWQGRPSRLHDRMLYVLDKPNGSWQIQRLFP